MRRTALVLPVVLAVTVALAACAGGGTTGSTPDPDAVDPAPPICETPSGPAAESVTVTGEFGAEPTVEFASPLEVTTTERAVVIEGDPATPGAQVTAAYSLYDGTTGEKIEAFGWAEGEAPAAFRADTAVLLEGFARTLACLGTGTRVVGVIPGAEGFGDAGADYGVDPDSTLVFVADVIADLSPAEWTTDVPEVGGTDEAPTVTLPATAPKSDLELVVLKEGTGAVVGAGDSVTVHYLGTAWETGEVFDQSYGGDPATFAVTGVVDGFAAALIGQKVGSRVLVTMPPSLGYGEAGTSDHALAGKTLVFLIDIIGTSAP